MKSLPFSFSRRLQKTTFALVISLIFNGIFFVILVNATLKQQRFPTLLDEKRRAVSPKITPLFQAEISRILSGYLEAPISELLELLEEETFVEQGLLLSDLALSVLVHKHFFDWKRALGHCRVETREYLLLDPSNGQKSSLPLFVGLTEDHRLAIREFARMEEWPFTAEGLFLTMQKEENDIPSSLVNSFFLTRTGKKLRAVCNHFSLLPSKESFLDFFLLLDWSKIVAVTEKLEGNIEDKRRILTEFFFSLIGERVPFADLLLFEVDPDFAFTYLSNDQLSALMSHIDKTQKSAGEFLQKIAESLRPESIRLYAREKLEVGTYKEKKFPEKTISVHPLISTYRVQFGDTLWRLSRKFGVQVETLKKYNHIRSDLLIPGTILRIPPKNESNHS